MQSTNTSVMPYVIGALLVFQLLPWRLSGSQMKGLAFFLWLTGGLMLCFRGFHFLVSAPEHLEAIMLALITAVALAVGFGKGKFVLSKTSRRNVERIDQFTESKKPLQVYSLRSWLMIGLMVGISQVLNILNISDVWRGGINLAIGFALIISSLAYLKAINTAVSTDTSVS